MFSHCSLVDFSVVKDYNDSKPWQRFCRGIAISWLFVGSFGGIFVGDVVCRLLWARKIDGANQTQTFRTFISSGWKYSLAIVHCTHWQRRTYKVNGEASLGSISCFRPDANLVYTGREKARAPVFGYFDGLPVEHFATHKARAKKLSKRDSWRRQSFAKSNSTILAK